MGEGSKTLTPNPSPMRGEGSKREGRGRVFLTDSRFPIWARGARGT